MISLKSEITKRVLNYFFLNTEESLYVNELSQNLNLDKRNLVKKLRELEKEGILKSEKRGNLKLYSLDKGYALYKEYKKIILKTIGFENKLKNVLKQIKNIKKIYIYGSYAKDKLDAHSDIDLLIIGDHNIILLQRQLSELQKEINREINTINMDEKEFNRRFKKEDPFIKGILKNTHIEITL